MLLNFAVPILLFLLAACSHSPVKDPPQGPGAVIGPPTTEMKAIQNAPLPKSDLSDSGSDLNSIPIEVNRLVLQWIDYFQGPGRPHMERYLSRSTRYMPAMKGILKQNGLPEDLVYIALIESGFSSTARSWAQAVGYWQFIRGTGRRYGLRVDNFVDERRDFIRSTEAAADYFKGLYNLFGNWYLAIASYNVGENRVKNLVMKNKTRDFWLLARENRLPQETIHYVPKFLAARLIAKNPEKYGFTDIEYMPPLSFKEVVVQSGVDLRKLAPALGLDYDDLRDLNPSFKRGVAFVRKPTFSLRVPVGYEEKVFAALPSAIANRAAAVAAADEDYTYYRVRRGETLGTIAQRFGISLNQLRQLNRIPANNLLIAGQRLRIPAEVMGTDRKKIEPAQSEKGAKRLPAASMVESRRRHVARRERLIHIVRKGDTLAGIADRYNVGIHTLAERNRIKRMGHVAAGRRLVISE